MLKTIEIYGIINSMNKEELIKKIVAANIAYRTGEPIITDSQFDMLVEQAESIMDEIEFNTLRDSLNEGVVEFGTKVNHDFIMGSLDKIKNDDSKTLESFMDDYVHEKVNVSAKVDGISCRIRYVNGILVQGATRGNGYVGEDCTNKVKLIKNIPTYIPHKETIDIRGELVIYKNVKVDSDKNKRNICAGVIRRKEITTDVELVSFVAYTILNDKYSKVDQFKLLKEWGFDIAYNININKCDITSEMLTNLAKMEHDYDTDGLVICDVDAHNEAEKYRPKNTMAFKINELLTTTTIKDVVFDGPSKDGYFIPIAIVETVNLGGADINRATLHNLDYIEKLGIKIGAKVVIQKLNDIIPGVTSVIGYDEVLSDMIKEPCKCPCCGGDIKRDGVNLRCNNTACEGRNVYQIANFLKRIGVEGFAYDALKNELNILTFDDVINFESRMNPSLKNHVKFVESIDKFVYNKSAKDIFTSMNFEGLAEKLLTKIINFYGWDTLVGWFEQIKSGELSTSDMYTNMTNGSLPSGIGTAFIDRFCNGCITAWERTCMFTGNTKKYTGSVVDNADTQEIAIKGSICVTGSLNFGTRNEFQKFALEHGYESKSSVAKGLTYLINNNSTSSSSKNLKAQKLGIKILTEDEFMKILNT